MHPRTLHFHTGKASNNPNTLLKGLGHNIWWDICTELGKSRKIVQNSTFSAYLLKIACKSGFSTLFLKCLWRPQNGSDRHTINSFWKAQRLGKELVPKALGFEAWFCAKGGDKTSVIHTKCWNMPFDHKLKPLILGMNLGSQLSSNAPWDLALAHEGSFKHS